MKHRSPAGRIVVDTLALKPLVLAIAAALPLLGHSLAQAQIRARLPAVPPNAMPVPSPIGWRVNGAGGAWAPVTGPQKSDAVITQTSPRAIYQWQSFDIGANSSLTYQFNSADGSALNRVTGTVAPSQIFGRLASTVPGANGAAVTGGTLLLINQNGILFGANSQVNTGALIASTLNVGDADYLGGFDASLRSTAPTFVYEGGPDLFGNSRDFNFVRVETGAVIETPSGGRVFLFAKNVDNAGTIRTPAGQTVLAGGGQVFLNDPTNEKLYASEVNQSIPGLRGLLVEVGGLEGRVGNTGVIEVPRGNATLVGMAVNQSGRISATTSVFENGSIFLLARGGTQGTDTGSVVKRAVVGGQLTLGEASRTEIAPDSTRDDKGRLLTADSVAVFTTSRVELSGQRIDLLKDAAIVAPGGIVNLRAEAAPTYNPLDLAAGNFGAVNEAVRVTLGAGARIDVSGTTATEVSAGRNFVTTELLGSNDLKDSPLQRDGPLYRSRITFDVRKGAPILGDTSSYLSGVQRSADEKLSRGGSVTLAAAGAVVTDPTSEVDVSGGRVTYTDAQVRPSTLISADGARFSANDAPADSRYSAVEGGAASQYDRWGRVIQFGPARERFEPGYVEGRDAGSLKISTPMALIGGQVAAGALIGERQRAALDPVAKDGAIELGTRIAGSNPFGTQTEAAGVLRDFSVTAQPRILPANLFDIDAPGALPTGGGWMSAVALNDSGAGSIKLTSYGKLAIEDGAALELPKRGSLELNTAGSQGVRLGGDITARGGSVLVQTVDVPLAAGGVELPQGRQASGGVTLRAGRRVDVGGDWVNQSLDGAQAGVAVAGGSVQLLSAHGLDLQDGSAVDVSGGATVAVGGAITGSTAGAITLASQRGSLVASGESRPAAVHIGADLRGQSLVTGGTLRLRAAEIDIRDQPRLGPRPPIRDGLTPGSLVIDDGFFSLGGFTNFDLEGAQRLGVDPLTRIAPQASRWVGTSTSRFKATGTRPADALTASLLPEGQRNAASVRLASSGMVIGRASGDLTLGRGASIETDAGASVALSAGRSLTLEDASRIVAPGGKVTLELNRSAALNDTFTYAASFQIRNGASVDVSGMTVLQPSVNDLRQGRVFDGGSISLAVLGASAAAPRDAAIDIAAGATLRADGAHDALDIATRSNAGTQAARTDISSAGGRIEIDANDGGARVAGSLSARSGGGTAAGGSFALRFAAVRPTVDVNPLLNEYRVRVSDAPLTAAPTGLGVAAVSSRTINNGGFADVSLRTPDRIQFEGNVLLDAGRNITLQAPVLSAEPDARVRIRAPGSVTLGGPFASTAPVQPPPLRPGAASLMIEGGLVAWAGTQELRQIDKVEVDAGKRLQFDAATLGTARGSGSLRTTADLLLRAPQTVVTTGTDFVVDAPGHRVTFTGGDANAAPLLSAGGALNINAAQIVQEGVVRAPFGRIAFNASESVTLRPGSVTSVSGSDLTVPFGSLLGGAAWSFNGGAVSAPPEKSIVLNAPGQSVEVQAGAKLALAGGGQLLAHEFVPGPGGSKDVFTGALDGSFAVIPGVRDYAPVDADIARLATESSAALPIVGQQITLGAGSALPAGTYAVLPARYATLPGAFLVTPSSSKTVLDPAYTLARPDGAQLVAGQRGSAGTAYLDAQASGFVVRTSEQARQLSEVRVASADAYFTGSATFAATPVPRLAQDAGSLKIQATQIALAGSIDFARSSTSLKDRAARGGEVDIAAERIVVTDAATAAAAAAPGTLVLTAEQINATGAASVLLGGSRSASGTGPRQLDVSAREVVVANTGVAISVADLIVAADERVAVNPQARITASTDATTNAATTDALAAVGDGALLRASSDANASVTRTGVQRLAGEISIGAGAKLAAEGLIVESTARTQIAADAQLLARAVTLGAPRIALGETQNTLSVPPPLADSLVVAPALVAQLSAAESLTLRSFSAIDLYGNTTVGGANQRALTLDSAAISVLGDAAQARVVAGGVTLANTSGAVASALGGSGRLDVQATAASGGTGVVTIGPGSMALQGVGEARIAARQGVLLEHGAAVVAGGQLVVAAPVVTARSGATAALVAAGLLRIDAGEPPIAGLATMSGGAGASLALTGSRVEQAGRIELASGRLDLTATGAESTSGIAFAAGSKTLLAGRSTLFDGIEVNTAGGDVRAEARNGGGIGVAASNGAADAAVVDVSAGGAGVRAGSLRFTAQTGAVQIGGTLLARSADALGGTLLLDSADAVDLAALSRTLAQGTDATHANFAAGIEARNRIGNQTLAAGSTLKARSIAITADTGGITVAGTLDASGRSGDRGGRVDLSARDDLALVAGVRVLATAYRQGGANAAGGELRIGTRDGQVSLGADVLIDTSGAVGARSGSVSLRAPRVGAGPAASSGTEVQVAPIAASFSGVGRIDVEAVKVYDYNAKLTIDNPLASTIAAHNSAFVGSNGAQAETILSRLADGNAALRGRLHLRSGVEVRSTGDITVTGDTAAGGWNLTPFAANGTANRPGGEPMNLTLRAAGNLNLQASLSDGFRAGGTAAPTTAAAAARIVPEATIVSGGGASLQLVAGADLSSASTLATLASETRGDVVIGKANTDVIVRTTTGTLEIAAGRDVKLLNRQAVAYTTGAPVDTADLAGWVRPAANPARAYGVRSGGTFVQSPFLDGGGLVSVRAERDVLRTSSGKSQYGTNWWWRGDSGGDTGVVSWWSRYDKFRQGFGSLGGGDVQVSAGRDARDVQLAAGSSGYIAPGNSGASPTVVSLAAGSATLAAERDVAGGFVFATGPRIDIHAGRDMTTGSRISTNETSLQVLHGNTAVDVDARRDAAVGRVSNAGLVPATSQYTGTQSTVSFALGGNAPDARLRAVATSGALNYRAGSPNPDDVDGVRPDVPRLQVIPAHTLFAAPEGSVRVSAAGTGAGIVQLPATRAELVIAARDALAVGSVRVNGVTASAATPGRHSFVDVDANADRVFGPKLTPLQAEGANPVRFVSLESDVTLQNEMQIAAPLRVVAGRDIVTGLGRVQMQHQTESGLSLWQAGRDITLSSDASGVKLHGPGDLVALAGRDINFTTSSGFQAQGNRDNPALPAASSRLTLAVGVAPGDWQQAHTAYFHVLGGTGVAAQPGELVAQIDAAAAGQSLPALGSAAAKAFDALPLSQQLDAARERAGAVAFDAALLALMRRQPDGATLSLADARVKFDAQADAFKLGLIGSSLAAAWSAAVPVPGQVALAAALDDKAAAAAGTSYGQALRDYVTQRTGRKPLSLADAIQSFAAFAPEVQLVFTDQVLTSEVRTAGRAAAALAGEDRDRAYAKAYAAIDTVFPFIDDSGRSGNLRMGASQLKTLQGSDIVMLAPRGGVNVGELAGGGASAAELGVVTTAGGGVSMIVRDNVDVNQSRVFTVGKGDLLIWAGQGNIDAGRGAKTVTGAPPPVYTVKAGKVEVDTSASFSGSGIAVLNADSTLDLYAPKGEINAGDAGIKSLGNAFLGASRFVGADNLAISGTAVGAPPPAPAGGTTAALSTLSQSGALAATNVNADDSEEEKQRKRRKRLSLILDFLGFGDAPAKP